MKRYVFCFLTLLCCFDFLHASQQPQVGTTGFRNMLVLFQIMFAAQQGHGDVVQLLVEKGRDLGDGINLNLHDNNGYSALGYALLYNHPLVARFLVLQGGEVSSRMVGAIVDRTVKAVSIEKRDQWLSFLMLVARDQGENVLQDLMAPHVLWRTRPDFMSAEKFEENVAAIDRAVQQLLAERRMEEEVEGE